MDRQVERMDMGRVAKGRLGRSRRHKMPLKSQAQRRWAHSPTGVKALGGKAKVAEWEAETPKNIPERVGKKRATPSGRADREQRSHMRDVLRST